jgi:hypothetical protein
MVSQVEGTSWAKLQHDLESAQGSSEGGGMVQWGETIYAAAFIGSLLMIYALMVVSLFVPWEITARIALVGTPIMFVLLTGLAWESRDLRRQRLARIGLCLFVITACVMGWIALAF